jgi:hypothetical protein
MVTHDAALADFTGGAVVWMDRGRRVRAPQ